MSATSPLWKCEEVGDDGELEPSEIRSTEIRKDSAKTSRPRSSGRGRIARSEFSGVIPILVFCLNLFSIIDVCLSLVLS